jgi:16S rRNA G966 N2-methylase RsmD
MTAPYYDHEGIQIYHGDARNVLPSVGPADIVITDPPYSTGRAESEFAATGNVAVILHMASLKVPVMAVFGTSSGRGIEFLRSTIRALPHTRVLAWHRSYVNSPAAGPWRWDLVLIHLFGKGCFGRPESSSLIQTDGTQALAIETGHKAPVPISVMQRIYQPFAPLHVLDPFMGSGSTLLAARREGGTGVGIEANEAYCEKAAERLSQEVLPL